MGVNMKTIFGIAAVAALAALSAGSAGASTVPGGNYCPEGQDGFNTCTFGGSPAIIKFEWVDDVGFVKETISSLFGSITGDEFTFSVQAFDDGEPTNVNFTYTPTGADPLLTGIVVKGSDANDGGSPLALAFNGTTYFGSFSNSGLPNVGASGKPAAISNITFFDTEAPPVEVIPLPAAGWLLLAGIGGLAAMRRRAKAA